MKMIFLIALLLPIVASASEITIFASIRKEHPATFNLMAGPKEAKLLSTRVASVINIGNGPELSWPTMRIELAEGVVSRIKYYATEHDLKLLHLRVFVGKDHYDTFTNVESLNGDTLVVGIPPTKQ